MQQIVDAILALPAGHPPADPGAADPGPQGRAQARSSRTRARPASSASASTARCATWTKSIELDKNKKHTIEVVVDRLVHRAAADSGDGDAASSVRVWPTRSRRRSSSGGGVVARSRHRRRGRAPLLRALRLRPLRHQPAARSSRATSQLQQPARRLPRPAPASASRWSSTRELVIPNQEPDARTRAPSSPGRARARRHAGTTRIARGAGRRSTASRSTRRSASSSRSSSTTLLYGDAASTMTRQLHEHAAATATSTTRRSRA